MTSHRLSAFALVLAVLPAAGRDDKPKPPADGFVPLFNGKDLSGWVNVNCHPSTFFVKDGEIVTTGKPTGFLRTEKQYENFELEMEWMHVNTKAVGNSGLFVWGDPLPAVGTGYTRGIEVQVLVNLEYKNKEGKVTATSHGDLFSIWGAKCTPDRPHPNKAERCLPSENRAKGGGEWNHYKVVANDGVIKLSVNGKEVSGVSKCNPRKGYLALESEDAECHFRNIRIKELPSTNPKPEECAKVAEGHVSLFNGLDLKGWTAEDGSWKAGGGILKCVGKAPLRSEASFADGELVFDWKVPAKAADWYEVRVGGLVVHLAPVKGVQVGHFPDEKTWMPGPRVEAGGVKPGAWNRAVVRRTRKAVAVAVNGKPVLDAAFDAAPKAGPVLFQPAEGLEVMNVFVRELK
jgi:hypothetical protein